MKVGDYIIFSYLSDSVKKGKAELLGCVECIKPLKVKMQPDANMISHVVEIDRDNIMAVLGQKPKPGKVFGVDTLNIYRVSKPIGNFGQLHYYCKPDQEVRNALISSFKIVAKRLSKHNLHVIYDAPINYMVKVLKGNHAGCYYKAKNGCNHEIVIDPSKATIEDLPHVILHELSHHLFTHLTEEWEVKWIELYAKHIKPKVYSKEQCDELKDTLASSDTIQDCKDSLGEEESEIFAKCLSHVRSQLRVSTKTLYTLFELDKNLILSLWPESITQKHYESIISEYATKSYQETFAEAISFYLLGKELPKKVNILCSKTIGAIKVLARSEGD